jgi:hypothetical protein
MINTLLQKDLIIPQFVKFCVHHTPSAANAVPIETLSTSTHGVGVVGRTTEQTTLQELELTGNGRLFVAQGRVLHNKTHRNITQNNHKKHIITSQLSHDFTH